MSKPCYSALRQHAGSKQPAIVFVPTRKHARTTALDLLTYAAADGEPYKFRLVGEADLEVYLARVKDQALAHGLRYGVGYVHETQPEAERQVVELLFNAGAIQVSVSKNQSINQSINQSKRSTGHVSRPAHTDPLSCDSRAT
jgi:pre-mRNA-splicing helicase BRR2